METSMIIWISVAAVSLVILGARLQLLIDGHQRKSVDMNVMISTRRNTDGNNSSKTNVHIFELADESEELFVPGDIPAHEKTQDDIDDERLQGVIDKDFVYNEPEGDVENAYYKL